MTYINMESIKAAAMNNKIIRRNILSSSIPIFIVIPMKNPTVGIRIKIKKDRESIIPII